MSDDPLRDVIGKFFRDPEARQKLRAVVDDAHAAGKIDDAEAARLRARVDRVDGEFGADA